MMKRWGEVFCVLSNRKQVLFLIGERLTREGVYSNLYQVGFFRRKLRTGTVNQIDWSTVQSVSDSSRKEPERESIWPVVIQ
jgi:hypothetical protein